VLRLHHDSIHTERASGAWIRRCVQYHTMTRREDLRDGERTLEAFLTHLAMAGNVSPSTQNQAMNALMFLDKRGLKTPMDQEIHDDSLVEQPSRQGESTAQGRFGARAWGSLSPACLGAKISGDRPRVGLAVCFSCPHLAEDPRTGVVRRHYVDASMVNKAIGIARRPRDLNAGARRHNDRDDPC
jgi:Phage integrase, N-terminal SAM-like domain